MLLPSATARPPARIPCNTAPPASGAGIVHRVDDLHEWILFKKANGVHSFAESANEAEHRPQRRADCSRVSRFQTSARSWAWSAVKRHPANLTQAPTCS